MTWTVQLHETFDAEWDELPIAVQDELLALMGLLKQFGPTLGRPRVDTLKGSRHANMKELRFDAADGEWPSPSIRSDGPFCWSAAISPAAAKSGFIGN